MVADALAGKIDLIVTIPFIRFARNIVDSLPTARSSNIRCRWSRQESADHHDRAVGDVARQRARGGGNGAQTASVCYYIANKGISVVENAGLMGLPGRPRLPRRWSRCGRRNKWMAWGCFAPALLCWISLASIFRGVIDNSIVRLTDASPAYTPPSVISAVLVVIIASSDTVTSLAKACTPPPTLPAVLLEISALSDTLTVAELSNTPRRSLSPCLLKSERLPIR